MRREYRPVSAAAPLLLMVVMMMAAASRPAVAQDVCPGFDRAHTITALGGRHAFAPGGVETLPDVQATFERYAEEIRAALAQEGLGDEVADALLAVVRQGDGITERPMPQGERLQWMAYRKDGTVATIDNVCLRLRRAAPAFEITVPVLTAATTPSVDCGIDVATDCRPGSTSTFQVRSAPGARVTLDGPGGTRTVIEGGQTTWTGPIEEPYDADYTFTVTNEAATVETVTTYTFLVPRECLNLALVGESRQQRPGSPVSCTERRTVARPACPVPPPPACTIDLERVEARRGEEVGYRVTGRWTELELELAHNGTPVSEPALTAEQGELRLAKRGAYTLIGTVTNEVGDTATCVARLEAAGVDWIVRAFAAYLMPDDATVRGAVSPGGCPCAADTAYGYGNGFGFGLGVERLLSERLGVELRGLYARPDDDFRIEANGVGISSSDRRDYWDLSLGLNVHLLPDHRLDWYVGPFVGYSEVQGGTLLVVERSLEYDAQGDVSWGAQTGLDWPFGDGPWALHAGARYTWYDADIGHRYTDPQGAVHQQPKSLGLDPFTLELGLAYRF